MPAPASLIAFARELFDYAGMFPPAELPLGQALRHYARHRREPEAWMLARFVLPAPRLADLPAFEKEVLQPLATLRLSVLARGGGDAEAALAGLEEDLAAIDAARRRLGALIQVESIEARLPAPVMESRARTDSFVGALVHRCARAGIAQVFLEAAGASDWSKANASLVACAASRPGSQAPLSTSGRPALGAKFRCGGAAAAAFPTVEQLASAIVFCRDEGVPWKATAGLHHPFRRLDAASGVTMHGFVNLFGAGILAQARRLDEPEARAVLAEEDPAAFRFDETAFAWRDHRVAVEEVSTIRAGRVLSIGSCSFEEPRDDLRAHGLLEAR